MIYRANDKEAADSLKTDICFTVCEEAIDGISNLAEVGLDSIIRDGVLRDIPAISTIISFFKIGNTVHEAHLLRKYACFLDEFNHDATKRGTREKYKEYFAEKNRQKDIEYLLIMIERYTEGEKARWLAKAYEAYLDGFLDWNELRVFSEVIDRFLPGDYETLREKDYFETFNGKETESLLRLTGLGLLIEDIHQTSVTKLNGTVTINDPDIMAGEKRIYRRTELGDKVVRMLG